MYEARGLLTPDAHSAGGHRLYGSMALARLAEIGVLKRTGFTLAEIGKLLERKGSATAPVEARIAALRKEVHSKSQALTALEHAWRGLASTSQSIGQLLENIKMSENLDMQFSDAEMVEFKRRAEILDRHFTPEEKEQMARRADDLGVAEVRQAEQQWARLIADVRVAMDAGTPPAYPEVMEMGRRWYALIQTVAGGDANLGRRMRDAYDKEPQVMMAQGMDQAMFDHIREAMQAAGLKPSA